MAMAKTYPPTRYKQLGQWPRHTTILTDAYISLLSINYLLELHLKPDVACLTGICVSSPFDDLIQYQAK